MNFPDPLPTSFSTLARVACCLGLFFAAALPAQAQRSPGYERSLYSPGGYYRYADTGDLTIRVQAWGNVRFPGLHEVPQDTRVSSLLAMAGGPMLGERREQDERTIVVRFFRQTSETEMDLVFEQQMTNDLAALDQDPVLQEGDVLVVDSVLKQGYTWRDYLPIASVVASLGVLVVQLVR